MGLFDFFKKKKISANSANFARLVKFYLADSGIPIVLQLKITKAIAKDFIDTPKKTLNEFFFMEPSSSKAYLIAYGLSSIDAEIFWSIISANAGNFIQTMQ